MTLDKARELLSVQVSLGGGYNRNAAKLILAEVQRDHGQAAVESLLAHEGSGLPGWDGVTLKRQPGVSLHAK